MKYNRQVDSTTTIDTMAKTSKIEVPEELEQCQEMIVHMHEQMQHMQEQMQGMQEQVQLLLRSKYGKKSKTIPVGQLRLFGEESAQEEKPEGKEAQAKSPAQRKHGRQKPAKELPRVEKIYDLPERELACPGCSSEREIIGKEISEQYDYTPASIRVIEHIRLKRACKG